MYYYYSMNEYERQKLQKLIVENNVEDNTQLIRELKHSTVLLNNINLLLKLKSDHAELAKNNPAEFNTMCGQSCKFLQFHYPAVFDKVKDDTINTEFLFKLIEQLQAIENGEIDQHDASYAVGKLLKQIYIDSVIVPEDPVYSPVENLIPFEGPAKIMTWQEFKNSTSSTITASSDCHHIIH